MKLSWKQVKQVKCASCIVTRHGVPVDVNLCCGRCYVNRLNRRADKTRSVVSEIYDIASQFTVDESHHICHGSDADYLAWLHELVRIGDDAIAAIRKALRKEDKRHD